MKPSPKVLLLPAFARLAMTGQKEALPAHVQSLFVLKVEMCANLGYLAIGCNKNELFGLSSGITIIKSADSVTPTVKPLTFTTSSTTTDPAPVRWATNHSHTTITPARTAIPWLPVSDTQNWTRRIQEGPSPPKDAASGLMTNSNATYLKGSRVVVSPSSLPDVKHLISSISSTAVPIGLLSEKRTALNIQSTARRGKSVGLTPAKDISDYQIGHAVDSNLILPDGTACPRDNCMDLAFCAFHPTRKSCVAIYKRHRPQKKANNRWINSLLTCAGSSGMNIGALFSVGD
ncbi:hypothetical protein V8F06_009570 [Rhypophila decipiens]